MGQTDKHQTDALIPLTNVTIRFCLRVITGYNDSVTNISTETVFEKSCATINNVKSYIQPVTDRPV